MVKRRGHKFKEVGSKGMFKATLAAVMLIQWDSLQFP
jgi:hypothetical protein